LASGSFSWRSTTDASLARVRRIVLAATVVALSVGCGGRPRSSEAPVQVEQPRPPAEGPLDQDGAEDLYKSERFAEAAWNFEYLLEHRPEAPDRLEFWLGKARFQLGDYAGSLQVFQAIASNPGHEYHLLTLPWLSSLAHELPNSLEPRRAIGLYPPEVLGDEAFDEIRDDLYLHMGQWHVHHGDVALGRRLLAQVSRDSEYVITAQFELGELLWREGRFDEAIVHHRAVLAGWSMIVAEHEALPRREKRHRGPLVEPPELERSRQRLRSQGLVVSDERARPRERTRRAASAASGAW
jgi:tetratricopeptide (TPR) repeat protein